MISTAYINIWGRRVGAVAWNGAIGLATFQYDPEFVETGIELAPVTMPLSRSVIYSFEGHRKTSTFRGLPGLLADALPDKYGNALINQWLVRNQRPPNSINPVETLCFIGQRAMGALEFEPATSSFTSQAVKLEISDLIEMTSMILAGRNDFLDRLEPGQEKALQAILRIGTSAGGARAKALISYNKETREVRSGQAKAPKGFEHYLIKFDGVEEEQFGASHGYGRVEMAYYQMAVDAGIEIMESALLEEHGRAHFMTKRFDRIPGREKAHVQSFCAMRHYDFKDIEVYSYEDLFETMRILGLPYPQAEQLFRRMTFNVLARNCDDHTKNFAFMLEKGSEWSLSPAFDLCHAYRPSSTWVSQHCLSINGKRNNIRRSDLLEVAKTMNIKSAAGIIQDVQSIVDKWPQYAEAQRVDPALTEAISSTLIRLK